MLGIAIVMGTLMFLFGLVGGFLGAIASLNPTGTILVDKSKSIDICRIELDKEISGKVALFNVVYVNNLQSASETKYIIGGDENGQQ